jgi:hypothetical protein
MLELTAQDRYEFRIGPGFRWTHFYINLTEYFDFFNGGGPWFTYGHYPPWPFTQILVNISLQTDKYPEYKFFYCVQYTEYNGQ